MSRGRKSAHGGAELTEVRDWCVWMEADETILIQYVTTNHSQGGDGMNFDHTFWVAAVTEMEKHPYLGASKTAAASSGNQPEEGSPAALQNSGHPLSKMGFMMAIGNANQAVIMSYKIYVMLIPSGHQS
ncbi:hypothetical protein BDR06DRAFT_999234 [Suillus hirtellus]|nr:hypothetical protein BDR06DRAFT_999234 [Suillus hirtellus]